MNIAMLLQRLETEQAMLAREALGKPAGRDAFEYGRMVGLNAGLERAKQVLVAMNEELERKGFDL